MRFSFSSSEGLKRGKLWRRSGTMHGLANYCFGCSSPFQRLCSSTKCPRNSVPVREKIESAVGRSGWSLRQPSTFDVLVLTSGQNAWLRTGEVLATARLFIGRKGLKQRATLSCQDSVWRVRTARKKSSRSTSATCQIAQTLPPDVLGRAFELNLVVAVCREHIASKPLWLCIRLT